MTSKSNIVMMSLMTVRPTWCLGCLLGIFEICAFLSQKAIKTRLLWALLENVRMATRCSRCFFFLFCSWVLGVDPCRKDMGWNRVSTAKASKTQRAINYTGTLTAYRTLKFHPGSLAHRWMFLFCLQDEFMNVFACV